MHLQNYPVWQVINNSNKHFMIQEDKTSLSIVSPINEYAFGILNQLHFTIENNEIQQIALENNSTELHITYDLAQRTITINDA